MDNYDVLVIGAGPGGYIAAIRCAQLGMKTACIERWLDDSNTPALGGTCLNVGCIPSKALLDSSHHFEFINHQAAGHGITVKQAEIDVAALMKRKEKIVRISTQGIAGLFRKHKIDWFQGQARLRGERRVVITPLGHHPATETIVSAIISSSPQAQSQPRFPKRPWTINGSSIRPEHLRLPRYLNSL